MCLYGRRNCFSVARVLFLQPLYRDWTALSELEVMHDVKTNRKHVFLCKHDCRGGYQWMWNTPKEALRPRGHSTPVWHRAQRLTIANQMDLILSSFIKVVKTGENSRCRTRSSMASVWVQSMHHFRQPKLVECSFIKLVLQKLNTSVDAHNPTSTE